MSEKMSRAEEAYAEGLATWEMALHAGGAEQVQQRAIQLFQEALNLGLDPSTEIQCRLALGVVLFDLYREQFLALAESDLSRLKGLNEAVTTLENALVLDAERGTKVLINRVSQSMALLRLNAVWQQQAFHIKKQFGPERKLQYLQEKLEILEYLGGVKPPSLCISLAFYYRDDAHNRALTLEWLKHAAEADIYEDIDGESSFYKIAEHSKHSGKKGVAEMSTPKRTQQKPVQKESSGGCFIATAVYGSSLAPEVNILRQFRDTVLLPSKLGAAFVRVYYFVSPTVATIISKHELLRAIIRKIFLEPILRLIRK